jgi:ABC-type amino acid transport system permease subunit
VRLYYFIVGQFIMSSAPNLLDAQDKEEASSGTRRRTNRFAFLYTAPWWLIILVVLGIDIAFLISADEIYSKIFDQLKEGIGMTLLISAVAYLSGLFIGLMVGLIRSNLPSPPKPGAPLLKIVSAVMHTVLYNVATLYVSVLRGLPPLVVLLIVAFVVVPAVREFLQVSFGIVLEVRGTSPQSVIVGLAMTYGAFMSETFRAGIQSVGRGQVEAARSLGMNYYQTMRFIVLPQAVRRILPPLGNDLVSMVKDSSLATVLGVGEVTQIAKTSSGRSFRYLETYFVVAVIYLTMTVIGFLFVRFVERRVRLE